METFVAPGAATRAAGLARLAAFVPHAGASYARGRNTDCGPRQPAHVSGLSPFLQRRLISEAEVVAAAHRAHGPGAEKFVQEVLWRTYWRGWLEHQPHVWQDFVAARRAARQAPRPLARAIARATSGDSGIACMDAWAGELVAQGWLHNHVRMWFASIWIFTLRLPWAAGADFFHRHLKDGDPASNTLSWRWVAGLQTRGKHYLARADNIARFTDGRLRPSEPLAADVPPLEAEGPALGAAGEAANSAPLPGPPGAPPAGRIGLLVTPEDLSLEVSELAAWPMAAVAGLSGGWLAGTDDAGCGLATAAPVVALGDCAMDDALGRAGRHWRALTTWLDPSRPSAAAPGPAAVDAAVDAWARAAGVQHVITPWPRVGPWGDLLATWRTGQPGLAATPTDGGWRRQTFLRRHDSALYPFSRRGYFHFKKHVQWAAARNPEAPDVG